MSYKTTTEQETKEAAKKILADFKDAHILLLQGDLGSGKTTFTKGIADALGVEDVVTSPTFVIMKVYTIEKHPAWKRLVHVDLYRLENSTKDQLRELGLLEYLEDEETLVVIEWPERVQDKLAGKLIQFEVMDNKRIITT